MKITCEKQPKSMVKLHLTCETAEHQPFLENAAKEIGKNLKVSGFRKGNIPFDIVKREVGESRILEIAAQDMIKKGMIQAIHENKLETVGEPQVNITKIAPGNDLEVEIDWALLPKITLPSLESISVQEKKVAIKDEDVEKAIQELRRMRATEAATQNPAGEHDKVVVDMTISVDKVPIEGGSTKDHALYLDTDSYVPGLCSKLKGSKVGDNKKFTLAFPKTHYSKMLAGREAEFDVTVKQVFERKLPEVNDEFAKAIGLETLEKLKELLKMNLTKDAQKHESERADAEMIDLIVKETRFGEIPEVLINAEKERLFAEFKSQIESQGLTVEKYLEDIKKTIEEVAEGFTERAITRIKGSLVLRDLAHQEGIETTDEELKEEKEKVRNAYRDNPNIDERLSDQNIIEYISMNLRHRKTTAKLREKLIKKPQQSQV